ncbi:MAG: DUF2630 family protein [Nocardioidaceae bacterium]
MAGRRDRRADRRSGGGTRHEIEPGEEPERLRELEVQLDQCWGLLR